MSSSTWPEGVIARYLTAAGEALRDPSITVDVTNDGRPDIRCAGCPETFVVDSTYISGSLDTTHHWAQEHAEKCRGLPKPASAALR